MTIRLLHNPPMVASRTKISKTFGVLGKPVKGTPKNPLGVRVRGRRSK